MTTVSLQIVCIIEPIIQHADWFFPGGETYRLTNETLQISLFSSVYNPSVSHSLTEVEFNVTGNYGSPVHTNHNANYSSMPSPDMDQSERKMQEQNRRPLSVATDNMMLEFYKKDGYEETAVHFCKCKHVQCYLIQQMTHLNQTKRLLNHQSC